MIFGLDYFSEITYTHLNYLSFCGMGGEIIP